MDTSFAHIQQEVSTVVCSHSSIMHFYTWNGKSESLFYHNLKILWISMYIWTSALNKIYYVLAGQQESGKRNHDFFCLILGELCANFVLILFLLLHLGWRDCCSSCSNWKNFSAFQSFIFNTAFDFSDWWGTRIYYPHQRWTTNVMVWHEQIFVG